MIQIQKASYRYQRNEWILKDVNLEIKEGEFISILGENGTGKSTLGKLIMGLIKPTEGKVLIDEMETSKKADVKEIMKKVGIVFQNPENQLIFNKVEDEMLFGLKNLGIDTKEIDTALQQVGMEAYKNKGIYGMSLGQKQRIAIAEILCRKTKYIILDEPTTMLDSQGKEDVYRIVKKLKQEGYTIIYITNVAEEILLSDRILILKEGHIAEEIKREEILEKVDILKKYHIKIPFLVEMELEMKKKGICVDIENMTPKELVEKILEEGQKENNE